MEPNVVFVDVLLEMRDLNISHNWAEDLNHCPYIEIDRKWVHTHLCRGQEQTVERINNTIIFSLPQLSNEQLKAHVLVLNSLKNGNTIWMIICGTDKFTLIKVMVQSIIEYSKIIKAVRIMALIGIAVFNIGGATIHHDRVYMQKEDQMSHTDILLVINVRDARWLQGH